MIDTKITLLLVQSELVKSWSEKYRRATSDATTMNGFFEILSNLSMTPA